MTLSLTERQTLNFINDYRRCAALWDPSEKDYTNKMKRRAAYSALCQKYNMDVKVLKSKIKNLRSYYLKEQQKMMMADSAGEGEHYESPWFAFDAMSFIGHLGTSRTAKELQLDYAMYNGAAEEAVEIVEEQDALDEAVLSCGSTGMLVQVGPETEEQEVEEDQEFPPAQGNSKASVRRLKRKLEEDRAQEDQAIGFFSKSPYVEKDECGVFGEMVAFQLRSLGPRNRAIARNKIQNVIFELEMQELDLADPHEQQDISFDSVEVKCDRL